MKRLHIPAPLILTLVITACSPTATPLSPSTAARDDPEPVSVSTEPSSNISDSATRTDEQGAIGI